MRAAFWFIWFTIHDGITKASPPCSLHLHLPRHALSSFLYKGSVAEGLLDSTNFSSSPRSAVLIFCVVVTMNPGNAGQIEAQSESDSISSWRMVVDKARITPAVLKHHYDGSGTVEDPFVVRFLEKDPGNPMTWTDAKKWGITAVVSVATLAVTLVSSAYTGGIDKLIAEFHISITVATLGISLFVLGFAIGPLIWAPLSEVYGRHLLFTITYGALTVFNAGSAGSPNIQTLLVLRFFAGAFGSSPLANAGGVLADMFPASQRGIALSIFASAPFLGPALGPIIGGFLGETEGWRWVQGFLAIFSGVLWIIGTLAVPETYAPVLLQARAAKLSKMTGKVYQSQGDVGGKKKTVLEIFKVALSRPWVLLFCEPIVLLLTIYMAIVYGTLYMLFAAFPIVYQEVRGWSPGIGGLSFLGVAVGMMSAVAYAIYDNGRYNRSAEKNGGFATPEARLPPALLGSVFIPVGLFWFAWTNGPNIHWISSIAACAPFGFGMVLVFLSILNYLIDSYTIFAASVLAANSILRSLFGAAFPLFTTYMFKNLGIHWASSIPAFLALACVPFPFLFYKYGAAIRMRCKYAHEADEFMAKIRAGTGPASTEDDESISDEKKEKAGELSDGLGPPPTLHQTETSASGGSGRSKQYEGNPFDIDRVNTEGSF